MVERGIRISALGVSMQHKVQVNAQYLEAIRMEAGGDQDDDIDLCCQSPKRTLRTGCGKVLDPQTAVRLSSLAASVTVRPKPMVNPVSVNYAIRFSGPVTALTTRCNFA